MTHTPAEKLPLFEEYPYECNLECDEVLPPPPPPTNEELASMLDISTIPDADTFYQGWPELTDEDVFSQTTACTAYPELLGKPVFREVLIFDEDSGCNLRYVCHCNLHSDQEDCRYIRDAWIYKPNNDMNL